MIFRKNDIDLLAIGDIAVDNFIKIKEVEEKCDVSGHCELCFSFANKIPYELSLVCYATGNSANAVIGASRLGLRTNIISYLGDDENGEKSLKVLKNEKIGTKYVNLIKNFLTNYHYVLWYNTERTILVKHTEFPYKLSNDLSKAKWVYLSSLASNSEEYHKEILDYLLANPEIKLAFQPGTFQMKLEIDKLKNIYERTEVFLCNKEEYQRILKIEEKDPLVLMKKMKELGPKIVVLTDGLDGSFAFDGREAWHMKVLPQTPYERTGAGDAYSSAFICALFYKKNIEEAMVWGSVNAMSVVMQIGPQKGLLTKKEIEEKIKEVGEDYKPIKIN